jgi:hypothetical protein
MKYPQSKIHAGPMSPEISEFSRIYLNQFLRWAKQQYSGRLQHCLQSSGVYTSPP